MPLRDHFRGWLDQEMKWHSFHQAWATYIAEALTTRLPEGFRASPNVQTAIEIDVAAFGGARTPPRAPTDREEPAWQPSGGTLTLPFEVTEPATEVLVHGRRDGSYLAAAIELVSEGNKDRAEAREAFIAKCETYLQQGVGLVIVDLVTTRAANLHDGLLARVSPTAPVWGERLYATAYSPQGKNGAAKLTVWQEPLAIGAALPTMPLWLLHGPCVPVQLEATYEDTFRRLRLPTEGP
ncbi:DUF4058 family protein [Gemmata sp. JC673]|uniref:DUF4058 family protein n=1 Tax=Gemmata algarum TaxID=2975278 RepID=A0ABU5F860_9BACT|nr:DUF4058 family protein [Gemmata algarum]MDY3563521.1 DUF4058 family protein [Gemmata algarum]